MDDKFIGLWNVILTSSFGKRFKLLASTGLILWTVSGGGGGGGVKSKIVLCGFHLPLR